MDKDMVRMGNERGKIFERLINSEKFNKQLHLWLEEPRHHIENDYISTQKAINDGKSYIETLQPHFLSFQYGYRLFVHIDVDDVDGHEITLGNCMGIDKSIRESHNIEKMLFAGVFDWFSND